MSETILRTHQVQRIFGQGKKSVQALQGVSMTIKRQALVVLKGKSGSGKTTLLNILGGLDDPSEGEIHFLDKNMTRLSEREKGLVRKTHIGFIFQAFALLPMLSAYENVEFGLRMAGHPPVQWKERIEQSLEWVGLSKRAQHRPYELSGGEQQRVAIARACAHRPSLILADEPTAELDSKMTMRMIRLFRSLVDGQNMTIVMTTHDPSVLDLADDIYELEDGRLIESATSEYVLKRG